MTSAYKVESNRRNARMSTGPRSAAGKGRVRFNALKHGLAAEIPVLPDEDPEAFAEHRDARFALFQPRSEAEHDLVKTYVFATWKHDRCVRAETGLIARHMQQAEAEEANREDHQVISLGQRLFWDCRGDLRDYPHGFHEGGPRTSCTSGPDDPHDPAHILIDLESTITGCRWLLARWAELKDRLSPGLSWHSQDKLKAIRLLGKQPLDAPDEPIVCLILVASHVVDPRFDGPFHELEREFGLGSHERQRFMERLHERPWEALEPANEAEARQKLAEVVNKAMARLEKIVAVHEKRAAIYGEKAALRRAFDPSDEAERLRRHERSCVRDMFRSLKELLDLRREGILPEDGEYRSECIELADQPDGSTPRASEGEAAETVQAPEWPQSTWEEQDEANAPDDRYEATALDDRYQADAPEDQYDPAEREDQDHSGTRDDRYHHDAPEDQDHSGTRDDRYHPDASARGEQKLQNKANAACSGVHDFAGHDDGRAGLDEYGGGRNRELCTVSGAMGRPEPPCVPPS
jgi:hypothetical protein